MKYRLLLTLSLFVFVNSLYSQNTDSSSTKKLFSLHFQSTVVSQFKPDFTAKYTGTNSLLTQKESKTSVTATLYAGVHLWKGASIYINPEIAGGSGLSEALGVADALNGETFRVGDPSPTIYLARLFYKQIFSLSKEYSDIEDAPNQVATKLPAKYLSLTIGKIGIADYFDNNSYSHDPRTQFLAWSLMSNGAWDYPANTRGYTPSVVLEYVTPKNELRYAFSLVPLTANGNEMNWNMGKANSQSLEYTHKHSIGKLKGSIKALSFLTIANMGNYNSSIVANPSAPDIETTRKDGRIKYGFALNAEQAISKSAGCFFRTSWNDGNNETWAFTEIDHSISGGFSVTGNSWKRPNDNIGLAYVTSGLSKPHRAYLQAGGKGFMLGDGNLNYAWEHLAELYYAAALTNNITLSGTYQLLINPGYNKDRQGPVNIFSVRIHVGI